MTSPLAGRTALGVTVNAFRSGAVDTAMQTLIRSQNPDEIGPDLHGRFQRSYHDGALITPDASAPALLDHLATDTTGQIWDVTGPG